jgi:hypothetical protein
MSLRVCTVPGCPTLVQADAPRGRCPQHRREWDKARGTRTNRGYGPDHQRLRATWQARIDAGEHITCWRCGTTLTGRTWHLGHDDHDRATYRGPECAPCNLSAAGRNP